MTWEWHINIANEVRLVTQVDINWQSLIKNVDIKYGIATFYQESFSIDKRCISDPFLLHDLSPGLYLD